MNSRAIFISLAFFLFGAFAPAQAAEDVGPVYQAEDRHEHEHALDLQGFSPQHSRVAESIGDKPNLFLSFDDGSSQLTSKLLDVLDEYPHVQVTFFVNCSEQVQSTLQRIHDSGHALGNHTCNHEMLTGLTSSQRASQFKRLQTFVNERLHAPSPLGCYRPPFGGTNDSVRNDGAKAGLWEWTWSVDPRDWEKPGVENILSSLERMKDGNIIVLHDSNGKEQTVEAVRRFLERHADDYLFRPLPHCAVGKPLTWNGAFYDDDDSMFEPDIEWLAEAGVARGCTEHRFCPEDPVTRGQMAAFLVRALGYVDDGGGDLFIDDDGSVFEADIDRLGTAGVTRGCNPPFNDRYCPGDTITRGELAALLARALQLPASSQNTFVDDDGSVFESNIQSLSAAGIIRGCNPPANDRFCPEDPVTRGQLAALLHRAANS